MLKKYLKGQIWATWWSTWRRGPRATQNRVAKFNLGWGKNGKRYQSASFMINCLEYSSINSTGSKLSLSSHIKFLGMQNGVPLIMKHPVDDKFGFSISLLNGKLRNMHSNAHVDIIFIAEIQFGFQIEFAFCFEIVLDFKFGSTLTHFNRKRKWRPQIYVRLQVQSCWALN